MAYRPLRDEIKKRNPFDSPEQEAALNLMRTASQLGMEFGLLFKTQGITSSQYNVLRILRGEGAALPCCEVAARMVSPLPDITRLVDRLESAGLAERARTDEDRRIVLIRITERGLRLLAELDAPVLALHRKQLGHLSREELTDLSRLLEKARQTG